MRGFGCFWRSEFPTIAAEIWTFPLSRGAIQFLEMSDEGKKSGGVRYEMPEKGSRSECYG